MGAPLAYVFWHWPLPGVGQAPYERNLAAFQASLRAHGPSGLVDALSYRARPLPWGDGSPEGYEDWYLLKDYGALGRLNDAAVSAANKEAHDAVAREAEGGAGGLYKSLGGDLGLREARVATWVGKPPRTAYQAFLERLSMLLASKRTDLWQRQLTMGPASEFCIHSEGRLELPEDLRPTQARLRLVGGRGERP